MSELKKSARNLKVLLPLGVGIAVLFAVSEDPVAQMSEIDSYDRAVTSQTKEDALAFLKGFRSSHLVGDLIESLRPEVAREVCADLPSGVSRARRACEQVRDAPMAEAVVSSGDEAGGTTQWSPAGAPTQPMETHPIVGIAPAPAATESEAAAPTAPQIVPTADSQSEIGTSPATVASISAGATTAPASASATKAMLAPGTTISSATAGASGATSPATVVAGSVPSSSDLLEPAVAIPSTPIASKPMVFVRSDSSANVFAQATDSSAIIGTARGNAPLRVLYRDRDWLKVLVPGTVDQAGWIHTSRLQSDTGASGLSQLQKRSLHRRCTAPVARCAQQPWPQKARRLHPTCLDRQR